MGLGGLSATWQRRAIVKTSPVTPAMIGVVVIVRLKMNISLTALLVAAIVIPTTAVAITVKGKVQYQPLHVWTAERLVSLQTLIARLL
jgi:hypothetical protein